MERKILLYGAVVFFCCFATLCEGQLSLESLPDVLFVNNSGVHNVELGTVIRVRCTASSSSAPTMTWFKDGNSLTNDPPHVRIRTSTDGTAVVSTLTVDNFNFTDDGIYFCQASNDTNSESSTTLSLTTIDDDSFRLHRNPVDFEIAGGGTAGAVKTYDGIRDNRTSYSPTNNFEPNVYAELCCQVFRCIIAIPGDQTAAPNISSLSVAWLKDGEEIVHVAGRTEIVNSLRYQSGPDETRYITQLQLIPFQTTDAGVYQCVYSDFDNDGEVVFSSPFRLDSDEAAVGLEAVSPVDIVLETPNKLVIEVESSGGYHRHAWYKNEEEIFPNGDSQFREDTPERFSEFFQVFVQDPTTSSDHGLYRVDLIDDTSITPVVLETQEFTVTPPVSLSLNALNTTTVTVLEGEDVNISCLASGNPLPSSDISWSLDGSSQSFSQTDITQNNTAYVPSAGTFSFSEGNVTSTLQITTAVYPTHDGMYNCSVSTDTGTALSDSITVEVQVAPEVDVSATSTRIAVGQSTTLTCTISRSNPSDYTVEWSSTNTNDVTTTLAETGETLVVTDIADNEFGTYTCNVTNSADLSGSANITIEEGALPEVTIADIEVALPGDNVTLNCSATGDTPLTYQWTMQGSADVINSDNSTGILTLTDITVADFVTYTCNVSNVLGNNASDITLELATAPVTPANESVSVVEGETLELMVTIDSNVVLDSITWTHENMALENGTDRVTIVNSDLDPPSATSTLTRTGIERSFDDGAYVVTATSRAGSNATTFTVDVTYPPDVSVTATRTRLLVSESTNITCSVSSSNPTEFTLVWTLNSTSNVVTTLDETGEILVVSNIGEDEFGTYTCSVTNTANLTGSASITIEQGAAPEVTIAEVGLAVPGDNITLTCSATGDTPFTYQWTMQGSTDVLNSDNSTGTLELLNIAESQIGTYICTVSNDLGEGVSNITVEQATAPVTPTDESVSVVEGETLELMVTIDSSIALDSITWTHENMALENGTDRVTIVNSDLDPPSATSTLTRTGIDRSSDGGAYVMTATSRAGSNATTFTVDVTYPPDVSVTATRTRLLVNESTNITCSVSGGNPTEFTLVWTLNSTSNVVTTLDETGEILVVSNIGEDEFGTYTCSATNTANLTGSASITIEQGAAPEVTIAEVGLAIPGDNVTLTCSATGDTPLTYQWTMQGSTHILNSDNSTGTLELLNIAESQFGTYTCTVSNALGEGVSNVTIEQATPPVAGGNENISVGIGEDLVLTASFSNFNLALDDITWIQNTSISLTDGVDRVTIMNSDLSAPNTSSRLTKSGITGVPDAGTYEATATNRAGSSSTTFTVEVTDAPTLLTLPQSYTFDEDSEARFLVCTATGLPAVTIYWQLEGENVIDTSSISISNGFSISNDLILTTGRLTFTSIQRSNAGTYTCVGSNGIGSDVSIDSNVTVNYPPSILSPPVAVEAVHEDTVELSCTAEGLPVPNILWLVEPYGGGVPVEIVTSTNITEEANTTHKTSFLTLLSVSPIDTANYTCNASNYLGSVTAKAVVEVLAEVEILFPGMLTTETVNETDAVNLTCGARGSPEPTFTWYIGEDEASEALISSVSSGDIPDFIYVNSTLSVSSAVPEDRNIYTCTASNSIYGSEINDSQEYSLIVNFAPVIELDPTGVSVLAPSSATLMCTARGEPPPDIVWVKEVNGDETVYNSSQSRFSITTVQSAATSTSTLTINTTEALDTANYSCMAENRFGSAESQQAEVTVFVTPTIESVQSPYLAIEFRVQELTCIATGVPAPTISFMRDGVVLDRMGPTSSSANLSERVNLLQQSPPILNSNGLYAVNRTLELLNPIGQDTGNYTCTASVTINELMNLTLSANDTFAVTVQTAPVIRVRPVDVVVLSPDTAMFYCEAFGVLTPNITWMRNGDTLVSGSDNITIITNVVDNVRNSTLQIVNTVPDDAASYTCLATNAAGNDTASATLVVNVSPVITTPSPATVYFVNEGMPATFECNATGIPAPDITWRREADSTEFNSTTNPRVALGQRSAPEPVNIDAFGVVFSVSRQLTLSDTMDSDSGFYYCVASNGEGENLTVEVRFELFVGVAPVIIAAPEDVTEIQGEIAVFTCNATGRPRPEITWWRRDNDGSTSQLIEVTDKIAIESEPFGVERERASTLIVLDVQPSDAGVYLCRAENVVDIDEENATLTVHVIPDIIFPTPNYQYVVNQFTEVIFKCNATGIPAPEIQFFLGDSLLDSNFNERFSLLDPTMETIDISDSGSGEIVYLVTRQLSINNTLDADSNNYSCVASNANVRQPMDSVEFELVVRVAPNITDGPDVQTVLQGDTVTFLCVAEGRPPPMITWLRRSDDQMPIEVFEDQGVTSIYTVQRGARERVSNLTIHSAQPRDALEYICNATNEAGNDVQSATLTVHVLPRILSLEPSPLLVVNQSDSAMFICNVTGIPAPNIHWFRGTEELIVADSGEMMLNPEDLTSRISIVEPEGTNFLTPNGYVLSVVSNLTITTTVGSDSGEYSCNASNLVGASMTPAEDGETVELFVQVPPSVVAVVRVVTGNESMSATLQFRIENADPQVLLSGLRWYYSRAFVNDLSHPTVMEITNETSRTSVSLLVTSFSSDGEFFNLTIENIAQDRIGGDETDAGRYFLQATNPAGTSVAFIDLEVFGPPDIIMPPEDEFLIDGSTAMFYCAALAFPPHYVEWSFNNTDGDSAVIIRTNGMNTTKYQIDSGSAPAAFGTLIILDVEYKDRGQYMCRAINDIGSDSAVANLTVHVRPMVRNASSGMQINVSDPATLVCLITGFPLPTITWQKDDEDFTADSVGVNIFEFEVASSDSASASGSGSSSDINYISSGYTGSGSIADLLRETEFSDEDIQALGELGVVSIVTFDALERMDTGNYSCTAINSLPGGETGVLMDASPIIPLNVLEVPNVPTSFTNGAFASRWVALQWMLGFDGNSDLLTLRVRVTRQISGESRVLEIVIGSQDINSYNVTEEILPFITYGFQVSVCNAIGCSTFTEMVTVTTEQDAPDESPTITESVSPTSTSLRISWVPPTPEKRNGILTDYVVCYTSNPALPVDMWQKTSTPNTTITLMDLSIFTDYTVLVAASTVAGVGPSASVVVKTLNDTCSAPLNLVAQNVGETTVSLIWESSSISNGIIEEYRIVYIPNDPESSPVNTDGPVTELELTGLKSFTTYTFSVTCVNGAGEGNTSDSVEAKTNSAPPDPEVVKTAIIEVPLTEQTNGRRYIMRFNKPDDTNGPISHYHAVAVIVPPASTLNTPPDVEFPTYQSIDNVYSSECEPPSRSTAYIAAEFSHDEFDGDTVTIQFTFGDDSETLNDNPRYDNNGPLCYSTKYAFFLRVYNDVSGNTQRSVRQTGRQYERFSSSSYLNYDTESEPTSSDNTATIAAAVVIVLVVVIVVVVVIVLLVIFCIRRKRIIVYKTTTQAVDFDTSYYHQNEHVQLTEYLSQEEGAVREPIPVGQFASYVERLHQNENCGFGEEYKIIQEQSPKNAVEACINPDNKPRNRYANIQCFDESRCVLEPVEGHEHDYINANFIDGYSRCNEYIATQGPLPNTVGDFWRLLWDKKASTIVMLTNLVEKMKVKCSQYWPNSDSQTYANITVTFKSSVAHADFVIRTFEVKREGSDEMREVHQFHYLSWPDFGVPRHATPLLYFLHRVRDVHHYSNSQPILTHCSAGVGRTGTLLCIDVELQRAQKEGMVDPFNYVLKMRQQRNHMVQTEAQYIFLYDAISEGTTSGGTELPVTSLPGRMKELEQVDTDGETGYQKEFNRLRQFRVNIREFTDANDDANKFKNRLANALPYNYNRVHLTMQPGISGSDYINASYIDGYTRKGAFIATQGPLVNTVNDFWRMVTERDIHVIVMLTQLEEKGKELCVRYWPQEMNTPSERGPVTTELLSEERFEDYIHREIKITESFKSTSSSRVVDHFQFVAWPENGAPESGAGMIDLIGQVLRAQLKTRDRAIAVHCSAGIGRTGAFCALSTAIERVKAEGMIDVFHTVKHLRTQRPHMVQTVEQYMFCYRAIREYVESLDQYSNFQ